MTEEAMKSKRIDIFKVFYNMKLGGGGGGGGFGKVFLGSHQEDLKKLVSAKVFPISYLSNLDEEFCKKITILKTVSSQFIVSLYDILYTSNNIYMFHEYCHDGDLQEYLNKKEKRCLSEYEALTIFRHIAEGFKELQKQNIIHTHLAQNSIMLSGGIAKIANLENFCHDCRDDSNCFHDRTSQYVDPQILGFQQANSKSDIWSVGVVLFEMLYGCTPWNGKSYYCFHRAINMKNISLKFPLMPIRSNEVKELLGCMLKVNEEERMSWEEVFNHPLVKDSNKDIDSIPRLLPQDSFEHSIIQNQKYLKDNLVAGYLKTLHQIKEENFQTNKKQLTATDIVNNVTKNKQIRYNVLQINEYVIYERNTAFFFNFTISKLIQAYEGGKLNVSSDLYFRILLSICKQQIIQLDKMSVFLSQNKSKEFKVNLWQFFKESNEFQATSDLINRDIDFSRKLYQALEKKIKDVIMNAITIEPDTEKQQILNRFLSIIDYQFILDSKFKFIFKSTLNEIIKILLPVILVQSPEKEILLIVHFLYFCVNPYLEFNSTSFDFWKFYEESENCDEKSILEIILQKLDYL